MTTMHKRQERILYNQLNPTRAKWKHIVEEIVAVVILVGVFTAPLWLHSVIAHFDH